MFSKSPVERGQTQMQAKHFAVQQLALVFQAKNTVQNKHCAICDSTSKGVAVACRQSWPYSIMSSFLPLYLNKLLPEDLSVRLQNWSVHSGHVTWEKLCNLWLYIKGRGRGVLSKSAIFNNVVFFAVVFERTPPTAFVRSASKFFSPLRRCNLRRVVLCVTLRRRAWP